MDTHPPHLRDERLAWLAVEPELRHGFWSRLFGRGHDHTPAAPTGGDFDASTVTPDIPGLSVGAAGGQAVPAFDDGDRFSPPHRHDGAEVPAVVEEDPQGRPDVDTDAFLDAPAPSTGNVVPDLRPASSYTHEDTPLSRKMQRYAVAVDRTVPKLSDTERQTLRGTGRVPDWFVDAVRKEAKAVQL